MRSPTRLNFVLTGFLLAAAFACQTPPSQPAAPPVVVTATTVNPNPADAVVPPNGESVNCSEALSPRLRVGESGRITFTNGQPVRVREQPGLSANIIARIPEGTAFTVMDGPVCADGWYWWKINTGNTGWASEGSPEDGYFLEPFQLVIVSPTAAAGESSSAPTAVYTVQTGQLRSGQEAPPDVLEELSWTGGGGTYIFICDIGFDVPILAAGDDGGGYRRFSNGDVAHITSLPSLHHLRSRDFPALCPNDPTLTNTAVAISPTGSRVQPYVEPSFDGTKKRVYLPLEAFVQPGLWHLVIEAPGQFFELGIEIPQIKEPTVLTYGDEIPLAPYDPSRVLLLGGFNPNERIVMVAFDKEGFAGAFDFQADSHGFSVITFPNLPRRAYYFAYIGEDGHVICDLCQPVEGTTLYNYYWGSRDGNQLEATPTQNASMTETAITNVRFCDAPCSSSAAHQLSTFPEATKKIYVQWDYSGMKQELGYTREWFSRGQSWAKYRCTWSGAKSGSPEVTLAEPGGLRSGVWEMVIAVEGQEIARASVQVAGSFEFWNPPGSINACPEFSVG